MLDIWINSYDFFLLQIFGDFRFVSWANNAWLVASTKDNVDRNWHFYWYGQINYFESKKQSVYKLEMIVTGSYNFFGILSELCKWSDVNNRIIRKVQIIQCNPLLTQFAWVMHAKGKESLAITRLKTEYIQISIYSYLYLTFFLLTIFFLDSGTFYRRLL